MIWKFSLPYVFSINVNFFMIDFVLLTVTSIWWRMKANIFKIKQKLYKIKNVKEMQHSYWLLSVKFIIPIFCYSMSPRTFLIFNMFNLLFSWIRQKWVVNMNPTCNTYYTKRLILRYRPRKISGNVDSTKCKVDIL